MKLLYLGVALSLVTSLSMAEWPEEARQAYVDRCSMDMKVQGWTERGGYSLCTCFAGFMSSMDYEELMNATPMKGASGINGRLYRKQKECLRYFPAGVNPIDTDLYSREGFIKPPPLPD
jgi:hypothetical protein